MSAKSANYRLEIRRPGFSPHLQEIGSGLYTIGQDAGNKIVIPDCGLDGRHAIVNIQADGFWLEDLNSRSGSFIEDRPVQGRADFMPGQTLRFGACLLAVNLTGEPPPPPPAVSRSNPPAPRHSGQAGSQAAAGPTPLPSAPDREVSVDDPKDVKSRLKKQIHSELLNRLDMKRLSAAQIKETDLHEKVRHTLHLIIGDARESFPAWIDPESLAREVYDEAVGLGPLEDLLANPEITEIMVNRHNQVYIEKGGKLLLSDRTFMDNSSVLAIIERIVAPIGRRIDESQPYVDARLKDGSRVNAIIPPLSLSGPCLTIRKFSRDPLTIPDLIAFNTMVPFMADFLKVCVLLRKNIVVSGGTGSGKTTFLNVMSSFIPDTDRIVTIEDSAELRLGQPHVVRLESRPPNIEGRGAVTIRDLLRNALRMRPDRIVIGECRGGETLDMLQAMNTGHDGSITTAHANSPRDAISRMETMTLMSGIELPSRAIREQIAAAIHLIVHTARLSDGSRRVMTITEVCGLEGDRITLQDIFTFQQTGLDSRGRVLGHFMATGAVPTFLETVKTRGLSLNMAMFDPRQWKH